MDKCLGIKFDGLSVGEYMAKQEAQLAQQAELIRRALEVMMSLAFKTMRTSIGSQEHDTYRVPKGLTCKARSLLPDLEKALNPKVNNLHREI